MRKRRKGDRENGEASISHPRHLACPLIWWFNFSRRKDARAKDRYDPLTHVNSLLASHPLPMTHKPRPRGQASTTPTDPSDARRQREVIERQRALALIAQSKKPVNAWDSTPSSLGGGRSWAEDFERDKERAGRRFFGQGNGFEDRARVETTSGVTGWASKSKFGGRSWEV